MGSGIQPATVGWSVTFEDISKIVRERGLMNPRPGYYVFRISLTVLLLVAGWMAFFMVGDSWMQVAVAAFLAFAFGQADLVGHDAGHRQIFAKKRPNNVVGYIFGNILTGVSFGWWVGHHTRHHNYPNHLDMDPDIVRRQVIFRADQRAKKTGAASAFIIRHQSWMFFLLILMEGLRLHLAGFVAVAKGAIKSNRFFDVGTVALHLVVYLAVVAWVLSPLTAVVFVLVHQGLFGLYMGLLFAPNHKGMPVRDGASEELDWLSRQVITSRNLHSSRLTDFLYGGLNYQIEHHLFPGMPRVNLRRAQPLVKKFCLEHSLPYLEATVRESYLAVSDHLGQVSQEVGRVDSGTAR